MRTIDNMIYRATVFGIIELTGLNVKINEAVFKGRMSTV